MNSIYKPFEEIERLTHEAMLDPQVGDRFCEMYTHWVYVVKVTKKYVWTLAASAPCSFPEDGDLVKRTREDYIHYYSYKSPNLKDKYFVQLVDRNRNVMGWYTKKRDDLLNEKIATYVEKIR